MINKTEVESHLRFHFFSLSGGSRVKRVKRELAYQGKKLTMYRDYMDINGKEVVWDFFHNRGGACVVPVLKDGRIVLVRQYREAVDQYCYEIPGGAYDSDTEDGRDCVQRELEEETGYYSDDIEFLLGIHSLVAFCDEQVKIYVAKNLQETTQHLDEEEEIEVHIFSVEEIKEMIHTGKITDAKTVAGLLGYMQKNNL